MTFDRRAQSCCRSSCSRLSHVQDAESSIPQLKTTDAASLVKKLQELVKTFPESADLRSMLLRAEDSLERAERARYEAAARASAIDLEIKAYSKLLQSGQAAKALSAIEDSALKYPESDQLQSLLLECREQIAAEQEVQLKANAERAAKQAAIDKGRELLRKRRYDEAAAVLEVAGQQWPQETQLEQLLSTARKSAERQTAEQLKKAEQLENRQRQIAERPTGRPRGRLFISAAVAALLVMLGVLIRVVTRPHVSVLTVESSPSGAEIEVEGRKCTTPNCSFKLSPGATYTVKADLQGYVSGSQSVALSKDQAISFELAPLPLPMPPPPTSPVGTPTPAQARLVLKGMHSGDRLFVDDVRLAESGPSGTWDLPPGSHRLRLMAGNQELVAEPRQFKANATVVLNRGDFKQPAPPTSQEQLDWQRIDSAADVAGLEKFLRQYPNSSFRSQAESKLENLYWSKASSSGSIQAFQDYAAKYASPPGPHLQTAQAEISRLEWEAIQNTTDPLQIKRYLDQNPKGPYHDRAVSLLDDLTWSQANGKSDTASLKGYLGSYPAGRHKDEATAQLSRLAPPPAAPQVPAPLPPVPPATPAIADNTDDLNAIRNVLDSYKSAYDTKDLAKLQQLWPDMTPKQVGGLRAAFRDAGTVTLTYAIIKGPEVAGNVAVVTFEQQIKTTAVAKSRVTMTLSKDSTQGKNSWHITSVR